MWKSIIAMWISQLAMEKCRLAKEHCRMEIKESGVAKEPDKITRLKQRDSLNQKRLAPFSRSRSISLIRFDT